MGPYRGSRLQQKSRTRRPLAHGLGWVRDVPDRRDHSYSPPPELLRNLPRKVDLRRHFPPVYDQLHLNSCSANAIAAAMQFDAIKQGAKEVFTPSRLFIWYNERAREGKVEENCGGQIRDGIKSVAKQGDCPASLWPYRAHTFSTKPPKSCYARARHYRAVEYQRMGHHLDQLRACLASGYPFVFGFKVYESFQGSVVERTGHVSMPRPGEKRDGGHVVVACGYDNRRRRFIVRNSWGKKWGLGGYFTIPYDYLLDSRLSHDFWTIRVVR